MSGKTTLVTRLLNNLQFRNGRTCLILDPNLDNRWPADEGVLRTWDRDLFLQAVRDPQNQGSIIVVDESGESIGKYGGDMTWLATRGRHYGHQCFFIAQRAMQIDVNVRTQCANVFVFKQGAQDARLLASEKGEEILTQAPFLNKGEYYQCVGIGNVKKKSVFA